MSPWPNACFMAISRTLAALMLSARDVACGAPAPLTLVPGSCFRLFLARTAAFYALPMVFASWGIDDGSRGIQ